MKGGNNTEALYKEIGLRIQKQIEKNGETQKILAESLGVHREVVTYWANGQRKPTLEQLLEISRRYNVSMDYLTTRTEAETDVTEAGKELQFVCEYTGLSDKAVEILHDWFKPDPDWPRPRNVDFLSDLITTYLVVFPNLLNRIYDTSNDAAEKIEIIKDLPYSVQQPTLDMLEEKIMIALYRWNRFCEKIPDDLNLLSSSVLQKIESLRKEAISKGKETDENGEHISTSEN